MCNNYGITTGCDRGYGYGASHTQPVINNNFINNNTTPVFSTSRKTEKLQNAAAVFDICVSLAKLAGLFATIKVKIQSSNPEERKEGQIMLACLLLITAVVAIGVVVALLI